MDPIWSDRERVDREFQSVDFDDLEYVPGAGQYYYRDEPFTGACVQRYADGKLENIVQMVEGVNAGVTVVWHPSGRIHLYRELHDGVLHGRDVEWAEDGTRAAEKYYREGVEVRP